METRNFTSQEEMGLLSDAEQTFFVSIYSATVAAALVGNVLAILVLCFGKKFSKELRPFLLSLAVSDISLALFSIPFTYTHFIYGQWIFSASLCSFVQMMQMTSVVASVFTLAAIGIDRHLAVRHPFLNGNVHVHFRAITLVIIWTCALGMGMIQFTKTSAVPFSINDGTGKIYNDCKELWNSTELKIVTVLVLLITFVLPLFMLGFTYGLISYEIWRQSIPGEANTVRDHFQHIARVKILKLAFTIVLLFNLCWLPLHIWNCLIYLTPDWMARSISMKCYVYLTIIFHWLAMGNSFVNPIIYWVHNKSFSDDVYYLLSATLAWIGGRVQPILTPPFSTSNSRKHLTKTSTTAYPKRYRPKFIGVTRRSFMDLNAGFDKYNPRPELPPRKAPPQGSEKQLVAVEVLANGNCASENTPICEGTIRSNSKPSDRLKQQTTQAKAPIRIFSQDALLLALLKAEQVKAMTSEIIDDIPFIDEDASSHNSVSNSKSSS